MSYYNDEWHVYVGTQRNGVKRYVVCITTGDRIHVVNTHAKKSDNKAKTLKKGEARTYGEDCSDYMADLRRTSDVEYHRSTIGAFLEHLDPSVRKTWSKAINFVDGHVGLSHAAALAFEADPGRALRVMEVLEREKRTKELQAEKKKIAAAPHLIVAPRTVLGELAASQGVTEPGTTLRQLQPPTFVQGGGGAAVEAVPPTRSPSRGRARRTRAPSPPPAGAATEPSSDMIEVAITGMRRLLEKAVNAKTCALADREVVHTAFKALTKNMRLCRPPAAAAAAAGAGESKTSELMRPIDIAGSKIYPAGEVQCASGMPLYTFAEKAFSKPFDVEGNPGLKVIFTAYMVLSSTDPRLQRKDKTAAEGILVQKTFRRKTQYFYAPLQPESARPPLYSLGERGLNGINRAMREEPERVYSIPNLNATVVFTGIPTVPNSPHEAAMIQSVGHMGLHIYVLPSLDINLGSHYYYYTLHATGDVAKLGKKMEEIQAWEGAELHNIVASIVQQRCSTMK